jgi:NAD dependent epimerase/dehydratase family enzyme
MYIKVLEDTNMKGVFNAVSPHPETNKNFIKTFAELKGGLYVLVPVPAISLKIALGEKASIVIDGQKVSSKKIMEAEFVFQFPELADALKNILRNFPKNF